MRAVALDGERTRLEPQTPEHAPELLGLLADPGLYTFTGGEPPDADALAERLTRQAVGASPDGREWWLNWLVRRRADGVAVGTVQATVKAGEPPGPAALAWVIAGAHQGHGYATDAGRTLARWLRDAGVTTLRADIHPDHHASVAVARAIGMEPTAVIVDGERRWAG